MNSDSYYPMEHTLTAYELLLNGMYQLPLSPQKQQKEVNTIMHIAKSNGYSRNLMSHLNMTLRNNRIDTAYPEPMSLNMRAMCNYHSLCAQQVTNLLKGIN
jgi:hypothetical protein